MALDVTALGARVSHFRDLKGMSLGALAEAAGGMAKSYLARIEKGEVENPGLRTLSSIAHALGVTVGDLLVSAEPGSSEQRSTLLAESNTFAHVLANLPKGLEEFLEKMKTKNQPVPADTVLALAAVQFRGRKPERQEDWQFLYDALLRSLNKK